jgi:integrase
MRFRGVGTDGFARQNNRRDGKGGDKMRRVFDSILSNEFKGYLEFIEGAGRNVKNIECYFKNPDAYLVRQNITTKALTEQTLSAWLDEKDISNQTRSRIITVLGGFSKYLMTLDLKIFLPEKPKSVSGYTPYIFSDEEFGRIIFAADMYQGHIRRCRSDFQFPVTLRVLYGCGLRLSEALSLTWEDVDLDAGVLTILKAKNQKQRFVPFSQSLMGLLKRYKTLVGSMGICGHYLFESKTSIRYKADTFHEWFSEILRVDGIQYAKQRPHERGPCPHCIRHFFAVRAFQKSADAGMDFIEMVPILSTYLGHDSVMETQKYLRASYLIYEKSHNMINDYIKDIFPQGVIFE